MIARAHRFHRQNSVRRVYQRGKQVRGSLCTLKYLINHPHTSPSAELKMIAPSWRAAVVVSRKVSASAVVRNRIRRRAYEALRTLEPPITTPVDLVITVFSDQLATMPHPKLQAIIQNLLCEAGVIAKERL